MSGGSFDHNLGGIQDGQGVRWNNATHELTPTDLMEEQPWTSITMKSPDGTLWEMTVDNTGAWVSTSFEAILTEGGDPMTTESGDLLMLE